MVKLLFGAWYYRKTLFLIMLFANILSIKLIAQDKELDSIKNLVNTYKIEDSVRVGLLIDLTKFYTTRDINKNLKLINEAIEIAEKINFSRGKGYSLNALSTYYILKGDLDQALTYALQAKKLLSKMQDVKNLMITNSNLARIYNVNGKHQKSLEMHLANVKLVEQNRASQSKAGVYFYVAKSYEQLSQFNLAEKYYLEALHISQECKFLTGVAIAEGSLGNIYVLTGNYNDAIIYLNRTLAFSKKYEQQTNTAASYFSLAKCYGELNEYRTAIDLNLKSIALYESQNNNRMLTEAYLNQSLNHESQGDYEEANTYLKLHYIVKDSIFSKEKTEIIESLQTKYETEKKEAEIASLSQATEIQTLQLSQQKYLLAGLAMLLLLLLGGGFLIYKHRITKQAQALTTIELEEAKKRIVIEKQYRESELKALRSQMNPHFIFNALNSIQEYIMTNEKKLAGKYLGKFADLMRIYLQHSQSKTISVNEEIETLTLYLELEKLRFEDTLEFVLKVDNNVDTHLLSIPTLLIQPYVENALKHGLLHKKENRILSIVFLCTENKQVLVCEIIDNGVGRKRAEEINMMRNPNHKSFATSATKSRLELLNYNSKNKISVETIDLYDEHENSLGTKVILKIPV